MAAWRSEVKYITPTQLCQLVQFLPPAFDGVIVRLSEEPIPSLHALSLSSSFRTLCFLKAIGICICWLAVAQTTKDDWSRIEKSSLQLVSSLENWKNVTLIQFSSL